MVFRVIFTLFIAVVSSGIVHSSAANAQGADQEKIREFLTVTGFDVAIESIQQGALAGPALTGSAPDQFGRQWTRLAKQVFAPENMIKDAINMIEAVMPEELLDHGISFYGSALGQEVVAIENESHMADDAIRQVEGEKLVRDLIDTQSPRLDVFRAMTNAVSSVDVAIRSIVEIQVRYLMAASAAGAADLEFDEEDLRAMLLEQQGEMRRNIEASGLISNAYTYRMLSDQALIDYLSALQDPEMQKVYEVLNAIQYEIMADRYEALAAQLAGLQPETDL
ncbi:hypothetical protein O2N63_16650 [Aliiroseovarius sp. KMU-50]|uniref:DUF2059 domain-containing protein n=1 Tax=Aliiroseovarius salicola TaxID=3009082 RepID=A0ABT4W5C6_9RHOB|nr:hypothetical protein [Aliiroseovarius sp. KMU-50]MDA5095723.1 hypothetical protein [Aliiroseovarius sp. KMU-50]